jgi:chemotaxis protein MotB
MVDSKVMRVVGLASTVLYDKQDAYNPINRRISIVIMNKRTEEAILADGKSVEVEGAEEVQSATATPAASR